MKFEFSENPQEKISADVAVVFCFSKKIDKKTRYDPLVGFTQLDKVLDGQLRKTADLTQFKANRGGMLSIIPHKAVAFSRIFVIGLGKKEEFVADDFRRAVSGFARKMQTTIDSASFMLPQEKEVTLTEKALLHVFVEGLLLGSYRFMKYKKQEEQERDFATVIIAGKKEHKSLTDAIERAELFSRATILARDLVNEPPTVATPTHLAQLALDIAKSNPQITCTIYDKPTLEKMGMEAFLGIARAADTPPKFIHLAYTPKKVTGKPLSKEKIAIVGKGITFDSGGINVKPGAYMHDMKMDMAGAACVLGVFSVLAELQPTMAVMGLIAATPNLISGSAIVPGDVVRAYNGKTIEILNTDAEGRVTMADSLSYAAKQGATKIIDLATLTGACMIALGNDISGLFSNNRDLIEDLKRAGSATGEKVWEMPLEKEYKRLNKSEVADIANIPSSRYGDAIAAALFLEEFVDDKPWAHLDIAGPAFSAKGTDIGPAGGTGFGVRMMLTLLSL